MTPGLHLYVDCHASFPDDKRYFLELPLVELEIIFIPRYSRDNAYSNRKILCKEEHSSRYLFVLKKVQTNIGGDKEWWLDRLKMTGYNPT